MTQIAANAITATAIADNAITDAKVASDVTIASVTGSVGSVAGNVGGSVASVVGNVGGNVTGSVASVVGAVGSVTGLNTALIDASISSRPTLAQIEASTVIAREATLTTIAGYVDTEVAAVKATTDKLDTAMELDGSVYRFTTNALEQAPAGGGGGGTDWTADERTAIRSILGVPASGTTPAAVTVGVLDGINTLLDRTEAGVTVTFQSPVADNGTLTEIIIGDDYLAANSRAFTWTIPAVAGVTAGTAQCFFGGSTAVNATDYDWLVSGSITVDGSNWVLSFDLPKTATQDLPEGRYRWSVEVRSASGTEITRVKSPTNNLVRLTDKQT